MLTRVTVQGSHGHKTEILLLACLLYLQKQSCDLQLAEDTYFKVS